MLILALGNSYLVFRSINNDFMKIWEFSFLGHFESISASKAKISKKIFFQKFSNFLKFDLRAIKPIYWLKMDKYDIK